MIRVNNYQRKFLENLGLLQHKRKGLNPVDANFTVTNRQHNARDKSTYVVETKQILTVLGYLDGLNLQPVSERQVNNLKQDGLVTDDNIQVFGTYKPNALIYQDATGHYYMEKVARLMIAVGIWKNNNSKKEA